MSADEFTWGTMTTVLAPITNRRGRRSSSVEPQKSKVDDFTELAGDTMLTSSVVVPMVSSSAIATNAAARETRTSRAPQLRNGGTAVAGEQDMEKLRDELNMLRNSAAALQVEVGEKVWAVERARELGTALDLLSSENVALRKENDELKARTKELAHLQHVQVLLLQALDATADPFLCQKLLLNIVETAAASGGSQVVGTSGTTAPKRDDVKIQFVATSCKNCLLTREERCRSDLLLREKGSWQQIQLQWDVTTCAQRYTSSQMCEVETERMWHEDILAHRLALEHLQQELTRREGALQQLRESCDREAMWKEKYLTLREAGRLHVDELRHNHEEALQTTRLKYLRMNPDMSLLRYLILSGVKSHFNSGKLMIFVANMQRKLLIAKQELIGLREAVLCDLQSMQSEFAATIRKCMPMEWSHVEQKSPPSSKLNSAPSSGRPATTNGAVSRRSVSSSSVIVRAPQLSPRTRNAKVVVIRSPTRR